MPTNFLVENRYLKITGHTPGKALSTSLPGTPAGLPGTRLLELPGTPLGLPGTPLGFSGTSLGLIAALALSQRVLWERPAGKLVAHTLRLLG